MLPTMGNQVGVLKQSSSSVLLCSPGIGEMADVVMLHHRLAHNVIIVT